MVTLDQHSRVKSPRLIEMLRTLTNKYTIDTDYLLEDIQKLEERVPGSRIEKQNINKALSYLRRIEKATFNNGLNLIWNFANNKITSSPVRFIESKQLQIEATDYVVLSSEHVVKVDYSSIAKLLMFDTLMIDLGYCQADIDKMLRSISPIQMATEEVIAKLLPIPDDVIELSKIWKVGSSYYKDPESDKMAGFYRLKLYNSEYYRDSCEATLDYTMALIASGLLSRLIGDEVQFNLLNITETSLKLVIPNDYVSKAVEKIMDEKVEVKLFGRSFWLDGKVTVY